MSLAQKLNDFAQAVALDVKALFGRSLPSGGLTGQVLAKTSGADYAVSWQNGGGGGGSSIQQVTVNIPTAKEKEATVTVTVPGVTNTAVISAFLVPTDEWDADELIDLAVSAQAGTDTITFLISRNGPIVGNFLIAYQIG